MKRIVLYLVLTLFGLSVFAQSNPHTLSFGVVPWGKQLFEDKSNMDLKGFSLAWEKNEVDITESLSAICVFGKEASSGGSERGSNGNGEGNGDSYYMLTYLNATMGLLFCFVPSMGLVFGPVSRLQFHVKPLSIGVGYSMSHSGNKFRFGYTPSALIRFFVTGNLAINVECNLTTMDGGYGFIGAGFSYTL